ncbi:DUF3709 domain-containing protein [Flavobacterium sp.]
MDCLMKQNCTMRCKFKIYLY